VQALLDSVGAYDQEKVVMFATYNNTVEKLAQHFKKYEPATIYGPNGSETNRKNLTRFRENGLCRLLIANPVSGGVGIKAGDVSQTVIFVEPVSTPAAFDQAASRVMLKGQTKPVTVYIMKVLNTLSPSLIDLMMGKAQTMLDVTLDKKSVFDGLLGRT
jgi:SNF2 family DNA or RNA helicase